MNSYARVVRILACVLAIDLSLAAVAQAADKKPAPPRSASELGSDLDDLESLLNNLEKNIGTYDETQRRSVYARLLALAEKIGVDLARQRQLLTAAIGNQPKNDPTGGLSKTVTSSQQARLAELNRLDARLKALRARIAALNPDTKAGVGPKPGAGGAAAGGGGTTVAPGTGTRKK